MKRIKIYLILFGALSWVLPLVAMLAPTTGNRFISAHSHPTLLTLGASFGQGALALWLAWGIHRCLLIAWRVGFIFLFAAGVVTIFESVIEMADLERSVSLGIKIALVSLVVGMFLLMFLNFSRRWHAQRNYFSGPHKD